ncbi:hypothetical protein PFBG_02830 [Plasmodium falciparum 7G8]|uniref:Uncharacterized protein n=1 Tax=Plasmodium falciparum (isolate 7G8) TaxID=57266 RepID=W7FF70_PLAF8|nr:hypothetical protein PFBG_02830 [Plasmodium falciparum 7G8]
MIFMLCDDYILRIKIIIKIYIYSVYTQLIILLIFCIYIPNKLKKYYYTLIYTLYSNQHFFILCCH